MQTFVSVGARQERSYRNSAPELRIRYFSYHTALPLDLSFKLRTYTLTEAKRGVDLKLKKLKQKNVTGKSLRQEFVY